MPETKNVLELMTEMLHEQENSKLRSNCAIDNQYVNKNDGEKKENYDIKVC